MPGPMQRTRRGRVGALGGLLAAGLLLAGVLPGGSARAAGPAVGGAAPDFSLTLFSAKVFKLSDLKGKPVLVNFFASW
ncbi:MAG: redoxin domain-containing protein [candidate division NC10 bacterium]|nr:redoxin domain-containing protein [candidate division NC10 bacterium]